MNLGSRKLARWLPNSVILTEGDRTQKRLYLTFDDGPTEKFTLPLLDLLNHHEIPASFFCIGKRILEYPDIVKSAFRSGHTIGNHSLNHKGFGNMGTAEKMEEINRCDQVIKDLLGTSNVSFRAPQGNIDLSLLIALIRQKHRVTHWSCDSLDYKKQSLQASLIVFEQQPVKAGDIILFHDDNALSIQMLEVLIPIWKRQNFTFGAINELI